MMAAIVCFCNKNVCVHWREPNSCSANEIEIEEGECVTAMTAQESAEMDQWLREMGDK